MYNGTMNKRDFLRAVGGAAAGAVIGPRVRCSSAVATVAFDFWQQLRARYTLPQDYIDLEHGFYSRQADEVVAALLGQVRAINTAAARYMRERQADDKLAVRRLLARLGGCTAEELIITRNTTESLDTVIAGFDWRPGDQAVMAAQDYGAMLDMFAQQAARHGIENRIVSLPVDPKDDDEIVRLYAAAITAKTRLLMVTHVVNITGQVLPVRKIAAMAHERGVPVLVDGAHSFAQLDFRIPDLDCEFYGASLHKWLGAPLGTGILYVRRDRIAGLWPLFGDAHPVDAIEKLNHTGTHPAHTDNAVAAAIALHEEIGAARKQERLRWLQRYWTGQVRGLPRLLLFSPSAEERTCAIATVGIDGIAPDELARRLFAEHRIFTVAIDGAGVHGVRVTPQLYTTTGELDTLVAALRRLAAG